MHDKQPLSSGDNLTTTGAGRVRLEKIMSTLQRNFKMSIHAGQEHWTHEIEKVGFIHVHNKTKSGKWIYEISTAVRLIAKKEYDTKEAAYMQALKSMSNIIIAAMSEVQSAISQAPQ